MTITNYPFVVVIDNRCQVESAKSDLPPPLSNYRVAIERMLIRGFAEIIESKSNIECIKISNYKLANEKIDLK